MSTLINAVPWGSVRAWPAVLSLWLALGAAAGSSMAQVSGNRPPPANTLPVSGSTNVSSGGASALAGFVADDKYRLRVGDKVTFQIQEDRDQPKSLTVTDSGELDVPYIGRVMASDKTCKDLQEEIKTALEKEYYYRATVALGLDQANRFLGRVYVWGQVRQQGPIDIALNENITAGKAILRAGGFADFANKKKVKIVRAGGAGGTGKQTFELNMVEILEQGRTEKDVPLLPEDSIIVPERLINF